jgi:hypothetical protein
MNEKFSKPTNNKKKNDDDDDLQFLFKSFFLFVKKMFIIISTDGGSIHIHILMVTLGIDIRESQFQSTVVL